MKNFQFKYKNIEDIKERIVKNSQKEYSIILKQIDKKQIEISRIKELIQESFTVNSKLNPKELVFLNNYRETLNNKLSRAKNDLIELDANRKNKLKQLTKHHQEHKVFEKLREKMHEDYRNSERKIDQKFNDEIANQKYCRREK